MLPCTTDLLELLVAVGVVLGEGFYTRTQMVPKAKGRPSLPVFLLTSAALVAVRLLAVTQELLCKLTKTFHARTVWGKCKVHAELHVMFW